MNEHRCAATDGGPCHREVVMTKPVPLCEPHRIEVGLAVIPDILRGHLVAAIAEDTAPAPRMDLAEHAVPVSHDQLLAQAVHEPAVYFIANGGQVKIGYTTNLRARLAALTLRPDNVLLTLAGGPELERALHARFAAHRQGRTEWFDLSPDVFRYIAGRSASTPQATPAPEPVRTQPPVPAPLRTPSSEPDAAATKAAKAAIRALYNDGRRPGSKQMQAAVRDALGLDKEPAGSTVRFWRNGIEQAEPELKDYPAAIA